MGAHARAGRRRAVGPLTAGGEPRLRRLVLIGVGRANLHLLRGLSRSLVRGLEVVLVTQDRDMYDPSMTSGLLRGAYELADARIDVEAVATKAGARVVHASVDRLLPEARVVEAGGERLAFDLCVIDEIGPPTGAELPGVVEHALPLRPASILADVRRIVEERLAAGAGPMSCTVVGGGTTGVECAFSLQRMLGTRSGGGVVSIVDGAPDILGDASPCRDVARHALERAGVCFALGARVVEVRADRVVLASGGSLPTDLTIWATGGAPSPLITASGLPHDANGRLLVDERLRARDGSPIWAAGDCAATTGSGADPRSQDPLLEREIRRHLGAGTPRRAWQGPAGVCALDTGDGRAILRWRALTMRSRLAWRIKRRLDRRFVSRMRGA
jgi:NADH dehydrogenase FAD-containing subunit